MQWELLEMRLSLTTKVVVLFIVGGIGGTVIDWVISWGFNWHPHPDARLIGGILAGLIYLAGAIESQREVT